MVAVQFAHGPWTSEQSQLLGLLLVLLVLLLVLRRGRSPTAIGGLVGTLIGCLYAWQNDTFGQIMAGYIVQGCIIGASIGGLIAILLRFIRPVALPASDENSSS
jgi:hypothetical protein